MTERAAIVIGLVGDSRAGGTNALIGTAGVSAAVDDTHVWNPDTSAWRDASVLGLPPYKPDGRNNPGRAIASVFRSRSGKPVYLVQLGVPGANIMQWLDPTAAHGLGSGEYWDDFNSLAGAAFASEELQNLELSTFDVLIVSLGTNNGGATRGDFQSYLKGMVAQCRQPGILNGGSVDLPVLWMEMQRATHTSALQNQTIRALRNVLPNYGIISSDQVSNVGDQVHEDSLGIEDMKFAAWRAWNSIDISYPDETVPLMTQCWPGSGTGSWAIDPWKPVAGFRHQEITIRSTSTDCYTVLDPRQYQIGDTVLVTNLSTAGAAHCVQPWLGCELGQPDRPGYYLTGTYTDDPTPTGGITGVRIYPGESALWQFVGNDRWELKAFTEARQHYSIFVGDGGSGNITAVPGDVLNGLTIEACKGVTFASGVFTTVIPGIYEIDLELWCPVMSAGYVAAQKAGADGVWVSIANAANGNGTTAWARTLSMRRVVKLDLGDRIRFVAVYGNVIYSRAAAFTYGNIRRLQAS